MEDPRVRADNNFYDLRKNIYPGRGIVMGVSEAGNSAFQLYWIMGRSENSRNRIFSVDGGRVFTEPADSTRVKDPSLIIYNAMNERDAIFVVSNGHQTDDVLEGMRSGEELLMSLGNYIHEPDAPNFTPRITGAYAFGSEGWGPLELAILRRSRWGGVADRFLYQYDNVEPGYGFGITTYSGDGDPLPAFQGEPILLPMRGDIKEVAKVYWEALDVENRVSLVVKELAFLGATSEIHIINKYQKVPTP